MNSSAAIGLGLAGAMAGVPVAAIAYATPTIGPVRLPVRWWIGGPARPAQLIVTAALAATAAATIGAVVSPSVILPAFWFFAVVGVGLAVIDVRCRRLPHRLTGALWASCGLSFIAATGIGGDVEPLFRAVGTGAVTTAVLLLVALAMPGQLGLGDVVLTGAVAFSLGWLGWHTAAVGVLAGLFIQAAVAVAVRLRRAVDTAMPMGPALVAGWLLAVALTS